MNYQNHYDILISTRLKLQEERNQLRKLRKRQKATDRTTNSYFENHHILPRCQGGTDDKINMILLTAREHLIAHLILTKIHPSVTGLVHSLWILNHVGKTKINSRIFETLRNNHSLLLRLIFKGRKRPKQSSETKAKRLESSRLYHEKRRGIPCPFMVEWHRTHVHPFLNKKHSDSAKLKISQAAKDQQNEMWRANIVKSDKNALDRWSKADIIYHIWLLRCKPNGCMLIKICNLFKITNSRQLVGVNMVEWFKTYGDPKLHVEWLKDFKPNISHIFDYDNLYTSWINHPWENYQIKNNINKLNFWLNLDKVYYHLNNNSVDEIEYTYNKSIESAIKVLTVIGDPTNNIFWLNFKNNDKI